MEGVRHVVRGSDDVEIGLLSAGSGSPLLLVHGGAGQTEAWQPVWDRLAARWRVTAMDRRGRGSSGDGQGYAIDDEFGDVAAVAAALSDEAGRPIDVFAHSYGATCTIGAGSRAAPFRRMVLYEPPARETVSPEFVDRLGELVDEGRAGRSMVSFLMDSSGSPVRRWTTSRTPRPGTTSWLSCRRPCRERDGPSWVSICPRWPRGWPVRACFCSGREDPVGPTDHPGRGEGHVRFPHHYPARSRAPGCRCSPGSRGRGGGALRRPGGIGLAATAPRCVKGVSPPWKWFDARRNPPRTDCPRPRGSG